MQVGIYALGSTTAKNQDVENLRGQLRTSSAQPGTSCKLYPGQESDDQVHCTVFKPLLCVAHPEKFYSVAFWPQDCFTRHAANSTA